MALQLSHLDGANGFRLDGVAAYDYSSRAVSGAGDVNGDGIDDLIIGAPLADADGEYDAGASYVVFGRAAGFDASLDLATLDGANGFRLDGADEVDGTGSSVAGVGDVNGDGIDDLIVGARYADADGQSDSGASYVVFGSSAGFAASLDLAALDGTNGFRLDGIDAYDDSGRSVAGAGDINGDGIDDLIVGAPGAEPHGRYAAGASYVVFGTAAGFAASLDLAALDGANGFRLDGAAYDGSGLSVSGARDVNGDGIDDLIVGAQGAEPGGASYVVFGTAAGFTASVDLATLDGTNGFRIEGDVYDNSGFSVAGAGDVNGDGIADLIVGAFSGDTHVVFGSSGGFAASLDLGTLDSTNGFTLAGSGYSVAGAGDVNGDGLADLIVGDPDVDDSFVGYSVGESYVVFGSAAGFPARLDLATLAGPDGFRLQGVDAHDESGISVAGAGDVNGDGIDDVIVGAADSAEGQSHVVFGSTAFGGANDLPIAADDTIEVRAFESVDLSDDHGGGTDRDADLDDLSIVAIAGTPVAPGDSVTLASGLRITLVRGTEVRFDGPPEAPLGPIVDSFTYEISDGQGGHDQALVEVTFANDAIDLASLEGALELRHLDGTNGFRLTGGPARDYSGYSVAGAGDVNGDGIDDVIVSAPWADPDGNTDAGVSYVVFGRSDGFAGSLDLTSLDGTEGFRLVGIETYDRSARSVAGAGDINGDGIDDLIVGANARNGLTGESYIVFGSNAEFPAAVDLAALDGSDGFVLSGANEGEQSGYDVGAAGDVNGDGIGDLIVGGPYADPDGKAHAGATYVVFGTSAGFPASLDLAALDGSNGFRLDGADPDDGSGTSVSGAGDINGDGIDDLLVGASNAGYSGASYVVFGRTTGFAATHDLATLDGTDGFRLDGAPDSHGDHQRGKVAVAGDINGDGIDDVILASRDQSYVVFGRATGFEASLDLAALDGVDGFRLVGGSYYAQVSGAGDVNGDGIDDLIVGAPDGGPGLSYVVFGSTTGFAASVDVTRGFRIVGIDAYDQLGTSVAAAGDVNGDGVDDLIVSAYAHNDYSGESYVVFGSRELGGANVAPSAADDMLIAESLDVVDLAADNGAGADRDPDFDPLTVVAIDGVDVSEGDTVTLASGLRLTFVGGTEVSIDGAGLRPGGTLLDSFDYLVSDGRGGSDTATVAIEFHQDALDLSALDGSDGFRIDGLAAGDNSGYAVASAGDINGDGLDDVVVGTQWTDASYVVFGASGGFAATFDLSSLDGTNGFRVDGSGSLIAAAGDVNGDGIGDLFVGDAVVFGTDAGFPASVDLAALDANDGFRLVLDTYDYGSSVAGAGDVNGDGLDDLIVGVGSSGGEYGEGRSYVVFGSTAGFDPTLELATLDGTNGFRISRIGFPGMVASGAGDLNGDGFDDVVIGVPQDYASGDAYVVFGSGDDFPAVLDVNALDGTNGFHMPQFSDGYLGASVAPGGDVNGDGMDDVIIGVPSYGPGDGGAYVIFGSTEGFPATFEPEALDGSNGFRLDGAEGGSGWSVDGAGDFNGDGIDDVIVGSSTLKETYVVFGTEAGFAPEVELAELDVTDGFRLAAGLDDVAGAGDINGDGFDDLIVGDPSVDISAEDAGASYVIFGFAPGGSAEATVDASGGAPPLAAARDVIGVDDEFDFRATGREHQEHAEPLNALALAGFDTWTNVADPRVNRTFGFCERDETAVSDPDCDGIVQGASTSLLDFI